MFRLHTWLGLHLSIVFAILFLSGLLLLFSPELKFWRQSELWIAPLPASAETVSVGTIYDSVQATRPDAKINKITSQPRPWFGRQVYGKGFIAHVSPYDGAYLGEFHKKKAILRDIVRKTHDSLLVPIFSVQVLVNALSLVLIGTVVAGLITYRRFWRGYFRGPTEGADARARQGALHRLVAVWVAPFLLISALSSAVFFLNAVGWKAVPPPPPTVASRASALPDGFSGADLDRLVATCTQALPSFAERGVTLPKSASDPLRIDGTDTDRTGLFGATSCFADPSTGAIAGITHAADGNAMVRIKALAIALHFGTWGGFTSLGLWLIFAAGSLYLIWSGLRVFAARTLAQRSGTEPDLAGRSTLALVVDGLGMFKWAYLGLFVVLLAMLVRMIL